MATLSKEEFDKLDLCDTCGKSIQNNNKLGYCDAYEPHACANNKSPFNVRKCTKYIPMEKNNE